ncbi:DsbA family protein [Polyangium sp. 6x1]|uniref:DsbA family oxidoreductase n=1 Tax=Polyangium sp. 6x1 TaxID=3042689 RepID=UPI002482F3E3|nr:DsbA family protein [Polyangium sp. 6x1]MDI1446943.1 DsbA family protein [Polyangium sp. 6x1]
MSEPVQGAASGGLYLFYGDLNCPFCHAQNERLLELGAERKVEWRGVCHMPHLPVPARNTTPEREELQREVHSVRQREPVVSISTPPARPNTERATLLVAAARRHDPARAEGLKTLLYRALWVHARDISDSAVLDELRRVAGLPELIVGESDKRTLESWQKEWEQGPFDRRIPVIVSPRGARLLGMGERGRVEVFLRSGLLNADGAGHCD